MLSVAAGAQMPYWPACRSQQLMTWKLLAQPNPAGLPRCVLPAKSQLLFVCGPGQSPLL